MSEILILHVDSAGEDLYKKLVEVIKESGHNIQKVAIESCLPLQFDSLRILPDRHQVFQGSREIVLTMKEFQILVLLAQNKGRVFSKEQIYNVVWQELYSGDCKERRYRQAESKADRQEQKSMPELRKEDETAVYRLAAL